MTPTTVTSSQLRPFLEQCGYKGDRLALNYRFGSETVAFAGFVGKPWDARSACLAVKDATADSRLAAHACIELGAPTALVCRGDSIEWWKLSISGPTEPHIIRASEVEGFFRRHKEELSPEAIYSAKLRRPGASPQQMWFVDVGLMPALERKAGEALNRLVTQAIRTLLDELGDSVKTHSDQVAVYKTVFWLLAAKLLREKQVPHFATLDLCDVSDVFRVVGEHYREAKDYPPGDDSWEPAITRVAKSIARWGHLGNVTTESLAYLYETALIDKNVGSFRAVAHGQDDVRKTLGIHSTPSPLVDHMLAQSWPLIETIPPEERRMFEPACGHAAFLTAGMRWLRQWSQVEGNAERHHYLNQRLRGIELDPFAVEIAKLSLTLADVPHGNTWQIDKGDMFRPGVLRDLSQWATVVFSNPPYENFIKSRAERYEQTPEPVTAQTKAVEMLKRTLPSLPSGAVFGFVLPQGALYDREAKGVRRELLKSCEIVEISLFEDKLFAQSDQEACIILGKRMDVIRQHPIAYRRVRNQDMESFKTTLGFSREDIVEAVELGTGPELSLFEPDLREVWQYTDGFSRVGASFDVSKGYEFFKTEELIEQGLFSLTEKPGWLPVALRARDEYSIWELPVAGWMDFSPKTYRARGGGPRPVSPQVIINHSGPRAAWRFRPVIDEIGILVSRAFLVFRAKLGAQHSALSLWAVLSSPVANAYAYCWSGKRHTLAKQWLAMPLPEATLDQRSQVELAALKYLALVKPPESFTLLGPDEGAIKRALLDLDAAVLRLYGFPGALERQLLSLFDGVERHGVGCKFTAYPEGWSSEPRRIDDVLPQDSRPIWERIASLSESLSDKAIESLPADGASQLDHFLYGTPKRKQ